MNLPPILTRPVASKQVQRLAYHDVALLFLQVSFPIRASTRSCIVTSEIYTWHAIHVVVVGVVEVHSIIAWESYHVLLLE